MMLPIILSGFIHSARSKLNQIIWVFIHVYLNLMDKLGALEYHGNELQPGGN